MSFRRVLLLSVTLVSPAAYSQDHVSPAANAHPSFDVVSIKPAKPGTGCDSEISDDRYIVTGCALKGVIEYDAYSIPGPRILGIPDSLAKVTFDINAKIDPEVLAQLKAMPHEQANLQQKQMIQQLLADRFKLAVHTETRQLPVYALVVAKGGSKLQEAKDPKAGKRRSSHTGELSAQGVTTADLADSLTRILQRELGRIVVDQTGLTGNYDLELKWTPDNGGTSASGAQTDNAAPSIFTAVQEQLGLKLQSVKGDVPVLVVDHAEAPSEN